MECKVTDLKWVKDIGYIRIYPEWNVKLNRHHWWWGKCLIGIYPEWNVKKDLAKVLFPGGELEYIQNGM